MHKNLLSTKVGVTESGETILYIYEINNKSERQIHLQDFTSDQDYFDAHAVFEYLSIREYRTNGMSDMQSDYVTLSKTYAETTAATLY